jgi:hypothetical protein
MYRPAHRLFRLFKSFRLSQLHHYNGMWWSTRHGGPIVATIGGISCQRRQGSQDEAGRKTSLDSLSDKSLIGRRQRSFERGSVGRQHTHQIIASVPRLVTNTTYSICYGSVSGIESTGLRFNIRCKRVTPSAAPTVSASQSSQFESRNGTKAW